MKNTAVGVLCIASFVSLVSAHAEYGPDHAKQMAAARRALEQKLYQLDHQQGQTSDTNLVAMATQPLGSATTSTDTKNAATWQPVKAASTPTEPIPSRADDWTQNIFTHVGVSYFFQPDATMDALASNGSSTTSLGSGNVKFNAGFRSDVTVGYNLNRLWAVEFDTGILWNSSDNQTFELHADTYTVPFMADLIYRIPLKGRLSGYVGAGAGGTASLFYYTSPMFDPNDYTFTFAYQAEVGLQYMLTKNVSLAIDYKFLGMSDPSWKFTINDPNGILPPTQYTLTERGLYTHSIGVRLTWNF